LLCEGELHGRCAGELVFQTWTYTQAEERVPPSVAT